MPKSRRAKALYQRGEFRLDRRPDRCALVIGWYDAARKRERSISAGTADLDTGKRALDRLYTEQHGGIAVCPACHRPLDQSGQPVAVIIANYLESSTSKASAPAIGARLKHVVDYLDATLQSEIKSSFVTEMWVSAFRLWAMARPIVSSRGKTRDRSPSTVENSILQLAAAFRFSGIVPTFSPIPTIEVNRTPHYRADIATLAAMFSYAMEPKKKRDNLLHFLRAAVATWARPDAVHDINTAPQSRQWNSTARVLALNPDGRRQTRKYRATIPIARQFALHLDTAKGPYVPVASIKSAWEAMEIELKLPRDGQSGMKLIRRSVAHIARGVIGESNWRQGEIMLGHHKASTSDIYALPDPANLGLALRATEAIIDQIEALAPYAFYRKLTAVESGAPTMEVSNNG